MNDDETIEHILRDSKTVAIVGLSDDASRYSYRVAEYLLNAGYHVIPVNPTVETVLGQTSYADLAAVPEDVDVVDVFRSPEHVPPIAEAAIAKGARALWLQDGVGNPEAEERAREAGLAVVSNTCMKREHERLRREGRL